MFVLFSFLLRIYRAVRAVFSQTAIISILCFLYQISKNYYCFILLLAFGQFSGHDHTILINEYQRNYDAIISKYVT